MIFVNKEDQSVLDSEKITLDSRLHSKRVLLSEGSVASHRHPSARVIIADA